MEDLINLIANVGFPIAIAVYLLIRIEGKLNHLTMAICELREAIITLPRDRIISSADGLNTSRDNYRQVQTYASN
jgi:hypothetical protein